MKQIRRLFGRNKKTLFDGVGWILNEDMNYCMICATEFSFFNGRHHCRACGNIICGTCSPQFIVIHELSQFGKQRVCNQCYWGQEIVYMSNNRIPKDLNIDFIDEDLVTAASYLRLDNENPIKKLLRLSSNDNNVNNINDNTNYNTVEENTWNVFEGSDSMKVMIDSGKSKNSPNTEHFIPKECESNITNITSTIGSQIHSTSINLLNQNRNRPSSTRLVSTFIPTLKRSENNIDNQPVHDSNNSLSPSTTNNTISTSTTNSINKIDVTKVNRETNSLSIVDRNIDNSISCNSIDSNSKLSNVSSKVLIFNNKTVNNKSIPTLDTTTNSIINDTIRVEPNICKNDHSDSSHKDKPSQILLSSSNSNNDNSNTDNTYSTNFMKTDLSNFNENKNEISDIKHVINSDEISNNSTDLLSLSSSTFINTTVNNTLSIPTPLFVIKTILCAINPNHKNEYIGTKVFLNILTTVNIRKVNKNKNQVFYFVVPKLKHTSDNSGNKAYAIDIIMNSDHALYSEDKVVKDAICSQVIEIILVNAKSNLVYYDDTISISDDNYCKLEMKYTLPLITNNYKSSLDSNEPSEVYIPSDLQIEEDTMNKDTNEDNDITVEVTSTNDNKMKVLDSDDDDVDDDDDALSNNDVGRVNSQNDNITNTLAPLRLSNSSISATAVRASNSTEIQKWNIFIKSTAIILALGMIGKKNPLGIMYRRKLILSSEPSLIYVDPVSMQIKGKIKWDKVITPRASIFSANCFEILSDRRTYRFYCDNNNQAAEWVMEINNAAKSLIPNFLDNEPESIYFSP